VDVLDEGGHIRVIAEMPGVEEGDVSVKVEADILEIAATGGTRQYRKEVLLPAAASPENVATSYRNGILEVRVAKVQPGQG
jgi:HSP20 family protein